ncbi:MAG: hypothetical protein B1H11_13150 [Desulfobacteraceae bacterium 4484_190.1]|nr:MAG: hypothetical protein B1H11_13150 [Desulfobacteraceae bacterium 4484_190.1]
MRYHIHLPFDRLIYLRFSVAMNISPQGCNVVSISDKPIKEITLSKRKRPYPLIEAVILP